MNIVKSGSLHFRQTLPRQFLLAGGAVMLLAMLIVGAWVAMRIEQGVVQNSATSAALYMESFVSPLSQELADADGLSEPALVALKEIFAGGLLSERVVSYKIWKPGGLVVYASDLDLVGQRFEPSEDQKAAWKGRIAASFGDLSDTGEDAAEAELGVPLLEVYSPIREVWTGKVIAVAEFYERADDLAAELADARRKSWLIVAATFLISGGLLYGIVNAGGRTIERQQVALARQLAETSRISDQNQMLKERVMAAAARRTGQTERMMQRVGHDLHDGVAQHLSLASLRLEQAMGERGDTEEAGTIRSSLDAALRELRAISRGLALPELDTLGLGGVIDRAVEDHKRAFRSDLRIEIRNELNPHLPYAQKLCVYRFLQEALSNVQRHAEGANVTVRTEGTVDEIRVELCDDGPGFDPASAVALRPDGGQGLLGLRDRAETLGGTVVIGAKPGEGVCLTLQLPIGKEKEV